MLPKLQNIRIPSGSRTKNSRKWPPKMGVYLIVCIGSFLPATAWSTSYFCIFLHALLYLPPEFQIFLGTLMGRSEASAFVCQNLSEEKKKRQKNPKKIDFSCISYKWSMRMKRKYLHFNQECSFSSSIEWVASADPNRCYSKRTFKSTEPTVRCRCDRPVPLSHGFDTATYRVRFLLYGKNTKHHFEAVSHREIFASTICVSNSTFSFWIAMF
jgi:hypothetical protein